MTRIAVGGRTPMGLRWPNYVNGRLLTALDLTTAEGAARRRDAWLGRAIGPGVVEGLEVTGSPGSSVLQVPPGTGVSPGGPVVHLDAPAVLDLVAVSSSAPVEGDTFADCQPPSTTTKAPVAGAYLLVARPASSYDGAMPVAPAAGAPPTALPTPCTSRWEVGEVTFAAIRLDGFTEPTTPANRRNLLAHWCFGSGSLDDLALSGFTAPVPLSPLAALADLGECDLPLAVFDWDGSHLRFVDRWSARRRPVPPPATTGLAALVGEQRTAEGEARFLQFQEQLAGLAESPAGGSVRARDVFPLLPPAGLVPMAPVVQVATLRAVAGGKGDEPGLVTEPAPGSVEREPAGSRDLAATLAESLAASLSGGEEAGRGAGATATRFAARGAAQAGKSGKAGSGGVVADPAAVTIDPEFFDGIPFRLGVVDLETVDFTIRRSWFDEPIDLRGIEPGQEDPVLNLLFLVTADDQAVAPYLLFTKRLRGVRWFGSVGGRGDKD